MAKILIAGDAAVIMSSIRLEVWRNIKKYRPSALVLMGGEDSNEPIFAVDVADEGTGVLSKYGACFCSSSHDDGQFATITIPLSGVEGDIKEYVADNYGLALINLTKLEETLPEVVQSIARDKVQVLDAITIV